MSGATVDLGNIKFNWKGPWTNSTAYVVNDTVFSSPHGYVCITAHTSHASDANLATSDSAYWNQMTAGRTTGLPDQTGQAGEYLKTDGATATWEAIVSDPTMGGDLTGTASNAQIAANAVTASEIAAGAVGTSEIAANAVTLAEMAGLTRGSVIVGDASGDPSALTVGTADQVLTSDGTDVSWSDSVGGASWAIKTANYTAVTGDGVMVDTDSAAITITLPASASLGDFVRIMDVTGNCATAGRNITVGRAGHNIQGAAADLTIATNRAAIGLVYVNATEGWVLIEN